MGMGMGACGSVLARQPESKPEPGACLNAFIAQLERHARSTGRTHSLHEELSAVEWNPGELAKVNVECGVAFRYPIDHWSGINGYFN